MLSLLAKAEGPDTSDSNLVIVVIAVVIIAGVFILAAIPFATLRRRRAAHPEGIAALMVIWGLLLAGSAIYSINSQMAFSKEQTLRIMQNFDPHDQSDRPAYPWMIWSALAVVYLCAIIWSMTVKLPSAPPQGFDVLPTSPPEDPRR